MPDTLADLIAPHPAGALAIGAPDRPWLTYGGLRALAGTVADALHTAGVGRGDRVAIVLPNGPEMAAAFVTIAQAAVTAPLNPAYRVDEFDFYLSDLKAKALVVAAGLRRAGAGGGRRGMGSWCCGSRWPTARRRATSPCGGRRAGKPPTRRAPARSDVALVLHTSGTTSRPKIVPLTQANVVASARNIGATLALTPADRCLNVMPLFHIHGLIAAVPARAWPQAPSIWCTPGFDALQLLRLAR